MTDITIPPKAIEAAAMEIAPHPWSMYTDAAKEHFRGKARAACLAMLREWPGMHHYMPNAEPYYGKHIILPLPKEPSDDK